MTEIGLLSIWLVCGVISLVIYGTPIRRNWMPKPWYEKLWDKIWKSDSTFWVGFRMMFWSLVCLVVLVLIGGLFV